MVPIFDQSEFYRWVLLSSYFCQNSALAKLSFIDHWVTVIRYFIFQQILINKVDFVRNYAPCTFSSQLGFSKVFAELSLKLSIIYRSLGTDISCHGYIQWVIYIMIIFGWKTAMKNCISIIICIWWVTCWSFEKFTD